MSINPWLVNNFIDSCAFDPKYHPEDKAAIEIFHLYDENDLSIEIAHSVQKEIKHPNTPSWVKQKASSLVYTIKVSLTPSERDLLLKIEAILTGTGKRENMAQDALHIFEAQKYGAYFVTTDKRLINKALVIHNLCGLTILLPSEFLSIANDLRDTSF